MKTPPNSIKTWLAEDRPREKLQQRGLEALTDSELLGIVLGSGTSNRSAVQLGRELLQHFGNLGKMGSAGVADLTHIKGIGPAKAIGLVAAFELGRRAQASAPQVVNFRSTAQVGAYLIPRLGHLTSETALVLYLNRNNALLAAETLSEGGLTATVVDHRLIFRKAIQLMATQFILAHNHPSGNPEPSAEDIRLTRDIAQAGVIMRIHLLDHLVVAGNQFVSLLERGLIPDAAH